MLLDRSESHELVLVLDAPDEVLRRAGVVATQHSTPGRTTLRVEPVRLEPEIGRADGIVEAELADGRHAREVLRERLGGLGLPPRGELRCMVSLDVRRERGVLQIDDARIELTLDHVRARRPGAAGVHEFSELVLELREGTTADLDATAQRLGRALGAEPTTTERYPYVREPLGLPPFEDEHVEPTLGGRDRVAAAARELGRSLLRRMLGHETGTRVGLDPEQLHKMRVTVRRLRTLVRVLGPAFGKPTRRLLRGELRWLARELGRVRDLDVQRLAVPAWRAVHGGVALGESGWDAVEEALGRRWDAQQRELVRVLDGERYCRLVTTAEVVFESEEEGPRAGRERLGRALPELLQPSMRRFSKAHLRFRRTGEMDDAHRLRLAAKELRYSFELFSSLWSKGVERRLRRLGTFQDALGRQQDAVVARHLVEDLLDDARERPAHAFVLGQLHGESTAVVRDGPREVQEALGGLRPDEVLARLERAARRVR